MKTKLLLLLLFFTAVINAQVNVTRTTDYELCDINNPGDWKEVFDLPSKYSYYNTSLYTVNFYHTVSNAQSEVNAIPNPNSYTYNGYENIFARVTEIANTTNSFINSFNIIVNPVPEFGDYPYDLVAYSMTATTKVDFYLNTFKLGNTGLRASYYLNEANAISGFTNNLNNQYQNISNPQTIWMRIESAGCYAVKSFNLIVKQGSNDEIYFPDANLKSKLVNMSPSSGFAKNKDGVAVSVDTNGDGKIQKGEALAIYQLDVSSLLYNDIQVSSLEGIENFTNLTALKCRNNPNLTTVNVSALVNLKSLDLESNGLTSLDVSGLVNLKTLYVYHNNIIQLKYTDCYNLTELSCQFNKITSLDLKGLTSLKKLYCSDNPITSLDLTPVNLDSMYVGSTSITTLDITSQPNITGLSVYGCKNLISLYLKNGRVKKFDVESFPNCPNLKYICLEEGEYETVYNSILEVTKFDKTMHIENIDFTTTCDTEGNGGNLIAGKVLLDENGNGCDATDIVGRLVKVKLNKESATVQSTFNNKSGYYQFSVGTGKYTVEPQFENPLYFNAAPVTLTFPELNGTIINQNFCITANGVHKDLEVAIVQLTNARPGFEAFYKIVYKNKGNQKLSGAITFEFNGFKLNLASATPVESSNSTGLLTFNYTDLLPFENRSIDVVFNVNSPTQTPPVNIGDKLNFVATATVDNDDTPKDNKATLTQIATASLDPNDIVCMQGNEQPVTAIGDYLHYVINFENIGTDAAEFVVVTQDINPADFDIESLELLNTSHNVTANVKGNAIEFRFDDINLDAKATGSIVYKIKSLKTLKEGDSVMNKASIVFDFNEAIATNEAVTTFTTTLGADDFTVDKSVKIYPNPAKDVVKVETNNTIKNIQLYDVQGRVLQTVTPNQNAATIDVSAKAAGIYFLKVTTAKGTKTEKLIKQ